MKRVITWLMLTTLLHAVRIIMERAKTQVSMIRKLQTNQKHLDEKTFQLKHHMKA